MDDLGVPPFKETPNCISLFFSWLYKFTFVPCGLILFRWFSMCHAQNLKKPPASAAGGLRRHLTFPEHPMITDDYKSRYKDGKPHVLLWKFECNDCYIVDYIENPKPLVESGISIRLPMAEISLAKHNKVVINILKSFDGYQSAHIAPVRMTWSAVQHLGIPMQGCPTLLHGRMLKSPEKRTIQSISIRHSSLELKLHERLFHSCFMLDEDARFKAYVTWSRSYVFMCGHDIMNYTLRSHQSQFNQPNFVGFPNSYDFSSGTPSCRALPHWRHSSAFKCESGKQWVSKAPKKALGKVREGYPSKKNIP